MQERLEEQESATANELANGWSVFLRLRNVGLFTHKNVRYANATSGMYIENPHLTFDLSDTSGQNCAQ
jgi:hypothetical protein